MLKKKEDNQRALFDAKKLEAIDIRKAFFIYYDFFPGIIRVIFSRCFIR